MLIGGSVRFISKILMAGFLFSVIVPTSASAFTGGMLSGDRTLVLSESPYQITSPIEIPYGTKLTVEPGVEIISETGEPLFFVNGSVEVLGLASQPVRIRSTGPVFYPKNATDARIKVSFASIDGGGSGSLVGASGYSQIATYEFSDSDFFNLGTYSYIWYPNSFLAERNVFTNSAGFSIGFDARSSAQGASAPVFRNNLFLGAPKKTYGESYWVKGWASYGSTLQMVGNTFAGGTYEAVRTATSYDQIPLTAQANFWGTEITSEIEAMVVDSRDGLSYGTIVDVSNFLTSPSSQSPTGRRFQLATAPTVAEFVVRQKTLASFSSTSTTLTSLQRSQVKAAVEANSNATKFICTGIRYVSQPMSENIKVRKRAKAACDYAKILNPELSTWYQNKPTEARSYAGKVLLTIKSPGN
jgi:hypothetical protein